MRRKGANYAEYFTATSIAKGGRGKGGGGIGPPTTKANSRFQRGCVNKTRNAHKNIKVARFAKKRVKRVSNAYQTNIGWYFGDTAAFFVKGPRGALLRSARERA